MIYPIYIYGCAVLNKAAQEVEKGESGLQIIIKNMFDTMYATDGIGLAAPQIGLSKRIFVIDGTALKEDDPTLDGFKKVFINAEIVEESGEKFIYNEGCLSVPTIKEDIERLSEIRIQYYDENFNFFDEIYSGIQARIIQHEYDHTEGKLMTYRLSPLKKRLLKSKLTAISKGKVEVKYRIVFGK